MKQLDKEITRILKDIERITNRLDDAGFEAQAELLDEASDRIEDVQQAFASL